MPRTVMWSLLFIWQRRIEFIFSLSACVDEQRSSICTIRVKSNKIEKQTVSGEREMCLDWCANWMLWSIFEKWFLSLSLPLTFCIRKKNVWFVVFAVCFGCSSLLSDIDQFESIVLLTQNQWISIEVVAIKKVSIRHGIKWSEMTCPLTLANTKNQRKKVNEGCCCALRPFGG